MTLWSNVWWHGKIFTKYSRWEKKVLKWYVSYFWCQSKWRQLTTYFHSHWLQLKTTNRIQIATTWGLWKVHIPGVLGIKVRTWVRIHKGRGSWIFIFLFSLELMWGQGESWNCAASTDSKISRITTFSPARGLRKRLLCAGDCEGDSFSSLSFLSQPCSEARPSYRAALITAQGSKTPRKTHFSS